MLFLLPHHLKEISKNSDYLNITFPCVMIVYIYICCCFRRQASRSIAYGEKSEQPEPPVMQEKQPLLALGIKPGSPDLVEQAGALSAELATMSGGNTTDLISAQNKAYTKDV